MSNLEYCAECGNPTGRAGRWDDSLFPGGEGPYCEDCNDEWPDWKVSEITTLRQQLTAAKAQNGKLRRDASALVEALERIASMDSMSYHSLDSAKITARAALAAHRKQGGEL